MWTATYDGLTLHDPRTDDTRCLMLTCDLSAGSISQLKFSIAPSHPLYGRMEAMSAEHEVRLLDGAVEVFRGRIIDDAQDMETRTSFTCEDQLGYLCDSKVRDYGTYASTADPAEWSTLSPGTQRTWAEWLIAQHNANAGRDKAFSIGDDQLGMDLVSRSSTQMPTTWAELNDKAAGAIGCRIAARSVGDERFIDLLMRGRRCSQRIEFGVNLLEFASTRDMSAVVTAIIPKATPPATASGTQPDDFGISSVPDGPVADGFSKLGDRIISEDGASRWGIIEDSRSYEVSTVDGLVAATVSDLADSTTVIDSLSISAVDLHAVDDSLDPIRLLDMVEVVSAPHGIDQRMECTEMAIDALDPTNTRYTLGAQVPTMTAKNVLSARRAEIIAQQAVTATAAISATSKAAAKTASAASDTAVAASETATAASSTALAAQSDAATAIATAKDAATLTITSTHGLVFKSNAISTTLVISVFQPGGNKITDLAGLTAAFGATARIEWGWQREDEDGWSTILASDSRLSNDGFALSVSPADVDARTSFEASVVTD